MLGQNMQRRSAGGRCPALLALAFVGGCVDGGDDQPAPRLGSIEPASAPVGSAVILRGGAFCQRPHDDGDEVEGHLPTEPCSPPGAGVTFGLSPAEIVGWNDEEIEAIVPPLPPGEISVVVEVAGRRSNTRQLVVIGADG